MKHLKIFENFSIQTETKHDKYIIILREQCNKLQSQYMLSRQDELITQLQYKQTLIHTLTHNLKLNEKDIQELDNLKILL